MLTLSRGFLCSFSEGQSFAISLISGSRSNLIISPSDHLLSSAYVNFLRSEKGGSGLFDNSWDTCGRLIFVRFFQSENSVTNATILSRFPFFGKMHLDKESITAKNNTFLYAF